jgi:hypothetical protein
LLLLPLRSSPKVIFNWLKALKAGVPSKPAFIPGVIMNWATMVGNDNTRWHWGSKEVLHAPSHIAHWRSYITHWRSHITHWRSLYPLLSLLLLLPLLPLLLLLPTFSDALTNSFFLHLPLSLYL